VAAFIGLGREFATSDATLGPSMCATVWMLDARHHFTGSGGCYAAASIGLGGESAPTAALSGLSSLTFLPIRSKKQHFKMSFSQMLPPNSKFTVGMLYAQYTGVACDAVTAAEAAAAAAADVQNVTLNVIF
jgi:hypothetical protein